MAASTSMASPSFPTIITTLIFLVLIASATASPSLPGPIKTIVVIVMENRSFDHMLGWLKSLNPSIDGVTGAESNPLSTTTTTTTTASASTVIHFKDTSHYVVDPDPGHSFQDIREQIFGGNDTTLDPPPMNGFAMNAFGVNGSVEMARHVMNGFRPEMVAVYKELVEEFAVFDRWFASVPTSTQPNRMFVHSATSSGATSNNPLKLALGFPQRTIFDNLYDEGIPFGIYFQDLPATLFFRNLRQLKYVTQFKPYGLSFKWDAMTGNLPPYTVIEQKWMDTKDDPATDDHPAHDVYQGQMFIKEVYETLRASPQWNNTLMIITYDEHGGFFDHVPTPVRGVPSPDGIIGEDPYNFKFDRLGVRVPTIMVSPWIEKATVVHRANGPTSTSEYEHSSIPATVKKLFNLSSPFLTKRDAWAGTFEGIITRTEPRTDCPVTLPTPVKIRQTEANEDAHLSEFQQELLQLAAVLKGDSSLTSYPEKISKETTVKQGRVYMRDAIKRFIQAGLAAKKLGVSDDQIVKMRPSLSSRSSKTTQGNP